MMESPFLIAMIFFFALPTILIFVGLWAWAFYDPKQPDTYTDRDTWGV